MDDDVGKGRPTLLMGGSAAVVFERARYADGWIMGGGSRGNLKDGVERLNTAWAAPGLMIADNAATDAEMVTRYVRGFADAVDRDRGATGLTPLPRS